MKAHSSTLTHSKLFNFKNTLMYGKLHFYFKLNNMLNFIFMCIHIAGI